MKQTGHKQIRNPLSFWVDCMTKGTTDFICKNLCQRKARYKNFETPPQKKVITLVSTSDVVMEENGREESPRVQSQDHKGHRSNQSFPGTIRKGNQVHKPNYFWFLLGKTWSLLWAGDLYFPILLFIKWLFFTAVILFLFHNCVLGR